MKLVLGISALAGAAAISLVFSPARAAKPQLAHPVIVELFTSEGCSSCPPAERLLRRLAAEEPALVPLELHVDYWNDLGWADPFSSPDHSQRQASYGRERVFTPELVVAGGESLVGSDEKRVRAAIARAGESAFTPVSLRFTSVNDDSLELAVDVGAHAVAAELWLAVSEDGLVSDVPRGENAGKRLEHAPVVRLLRRAGRLPAARATVAQYASIPLARAWARSRLRVIAFVQEQGARGPGAISGAASASLP